MIRASRLLEAGVRIHERRDALLHAKTVVVDGVWSTVGSANMDRRSLQLNFENNLVIDDAATSATIRERRACDSAAGVQASPRSG